MLESLESRRFLSVSLAGNVLTITGTTGNDDIALAAGKRTFVVHDNGREHAFNVNTAKTIRINGGRGDDSIIISPKLSIRASIEAGAGNDRIGGGAGRDTIFGQQGNDTLVGNAGEDYLDGGADDDLLIEPAVAVPDVLHGGGGTDRAIFGQGKYGSGVEEYETLPTAGLTGIKSDLVRIDGRTLLTLREYLPSGSTVSWGELRYADWLGGYLVSYQVGDLAQDGSTGVVTKTFDVTAAGGHRLFYRRILHHDDFPGDFIPLRV